MKKMTWKQRIVLPLILATLALGGCSQKQTDTGKLMGGSSKGTVAEKQGPKGGTIRGGNASGVNSRNINGNRSNPNANRSAGNGARHDTSDITLAGLNDPNNLLSQRIIYFDYDKAAIRPEYMVLINTHAKLAAKYPNLRMRLEGHADERGTREYNVALSEQRAQSVKRLMGAHGARASQIRTIGYGEEKPVVAGHGERSWQKNRRVEIKYDKY